MDFELYFILPVVTETDANALAFIYAKQKKVF